MRSLKSELIRLGFRPSEPRKGTRVNRGKKKREERLTEREWRELMGQNRPTYFRGKGGAIRRR